MWLRSAPGPHVIGEPKLLLQVVVLPEPLLGEDVMDKLINEFGSLTPLQQATPLRNCFSIDDIRTLVAKQLGVDLEFVTSETHFTNDLGADLLDRVELMLAIEAKFAGVEITDDDVEQIQVVGDLVRHVMQSR